MRGTGGRPAGADPNSQADCAAVAARLALAVLEDHHLLGKQIVRTVLRASGRPVLDYGRRTVDQAVSQVRDDRVDIVLISTLMLPSALRVREVVTQLRQESPQTRVVVVATALSL